MRIAYAAEPCTSGSEVAQLRGQLQRAGAPARPGSEHIKRLWDREHACWVARLMPGDYYVAEPGEAIATVLGSCISACLRDPLHGIGGMNHFMLPEDATGGRSTWSQPELGLAARFGSHAMEVLINDLLKRGARRDRLELKLFGGGRVLASMTDVGARNIAFVRDFASMEGLRVTAEDMGSVHPRRVLYFPTSGRALVKRLRAVDTGMVVSRERRYLDRLTAQPAADDVELF